MVMRAAIHAGVLATLWLIISEGAAGSWAVGAPVVGLATVVSLRLSPSPAVPAVGRLSLPGAAAFIPFFLWQTARGSWDVACRAVHPRMPLAPAITMYRTVLPPGPWRVLFANCVTLLPGTLSADLEGAELTVHALDATQPVRTDLQRLEHRVAAVFDLTHGDSPG